MILFQGGAHLADSISTDFHTLSLSPCGRGSSCATLDREKESGIVYRTFAGQAFVPTRDRKSGTGKKDPFDIRLARPIYSPNNSPMRKWNMKKRNSRSFPSITEIFFWLSILSGNKRGLISRQKSFPFVYLVASTPSFLFFTPAIIHFPQPLDDVSFGSFPFFSALSPSIVENLTRIPHCKV